MLGFTILGLILLNEELRIIELGYPIAVQNDPLQNPVQVVSQSDVKIVLEDGREFEVETYPEGLQVRLAECNYRIEIEESGYDSSFIIYSQEKRFICGTPWEALVKIPVIPQKVNVNARSEIGYATFIQD